MAQLLLLFTHSRLATSSMKKQRFTNQKWWQIGFRIASIVRGCQSRKMSLGSGETGDSNPPGRAAHKFRRIMVFHNNIEPNLERMLSEYRRICDKN